MAQLPLPPPPLSKDPQQDRWFILLWKRVNSAGQILWSYLDFGGSNLADLETRNYKDLQNIPARPVFLCDEASDDWLAIPGPRGIQGERGERGPVMFAEEGQEEWSALHGPTITPLDAYVSAGILAKPSFADNGDGSVTVGTGTYVLYPSTVSPHPQLFTLPGGTFILTDLVNNYIQLSYGAGAPVLANSTDRSAIDQVTVIPVYTVYRSGILLSTIDFDTQTVALANKLSDRLARTERFSNEIGGQVLGEIGTRNITITSGAVWIAAVRLLLSAYSSATDNVIFYFHAAGIWNKSTVTQYNNTQYDDGANLQTLLPIRYAVNWVYRSAAAGGNKAFYVMGGGNYTLAQAVNSTVPIALPVEIVSTGVLVGRIIVQQGAATATQIDSAFTQTFAGGGSSGTITGPVGPPGFGLDGADGEDGMMGPPGVSRPFPYWVLPFAAAHG